MAGFSGIIPPTVTLFNDDMSIDWDGTLRHLDWLIAAGVHGLFILGTTGEFTQFTVTERKEYAQKAVEHVKGRVPVIIGTGSVNTRETIDLTRHAKGVGADAAAVVTPYYQTLGDEQLLAHYGAVANAVDLPILVYNIPVFTGTAVSTPLLAQLAEENDNIVGVKDSVDSAALTRSRVQALKRVRPDFSILTGLSEHLMNTLMLGGDGAVIGEANFAPVSAVGCVEAFRQGDYEGARRHFLDLMRVATVTQVSGTFQAAIKEAMRALGQTEKTTVRLPGTSLQPEVRAQVRRNLEAVGMLAAETPRAPEPAPADDLDSEPANVGAKAGFSVDLDD
jgi:4-hydroxy-tetrahydrodipicolinate synthase